MPARLIVLAMMLLAVPRVVSAGDLTQDTATITGVVLDGNTSYPVFGVSVTNRRTQRGAVTDEQGRFSLEASPGDILDLHYVDFAPLAVPVTASRTYTIRLTPIVSAFAEQVVVVGSRYGSRTVIDSPVPIDVIDVAALAQTTGQAELSQVLQAAAPSFNATKQSGSDGADHIDPASLRGLGPDQTLVLINGKRRHQSSLVNLFGTRGRGNTGTDLNAIPASAIKRIEILRDGASAQYGSDAIAGVVNIVLKDARDGLTGGVTFGAYSTAIGEGWAEQAGERLWNVDGKDRLDGKTRRFDGQTLTFDVNQGIALGSSGGYANVTAEFVTREHTLRPGFSWRKGNGTPAVDGFNVMLNASVPFGDSTEVYAFGGSGLRNTDAYAFSRESFADGDHRSVPSLYPNGVTPHITSDINDVAVTAGLRHVMASGWKADISHTFGRNAFHYYITGTNNASLGAASPTDFDAGGHRLSMNVTNIDFSKFHTGIAAGLNLAFGLEFRAERFGVFAGEEGSYVQVPALDANGDVLPGGSQGFPGHTPGNEVDRGRTNLGLYADAELNVTDALLVGGALRFERYSDFGRTANFKVAARRKLGDRFSVRGSVSSGFRAPSLAQIHYNLTFNNIVDGQSFPTLLAANTSPVTRAFGIGPLQEETALDGSIGVTFTSGGLTATADAYTIAVDNRIVLTDNFDASGLGLGVQAAQFFANGVDTKTNGLDVVVSYARQLSTGRSFTVGLSGNFNSLDVESVHNGSLDPFTFFGPYSQAFLKAAAPDYKIGAHAGLTAGRVSANVFLTRFSDVILQDFQWVASPPTNQAEADALFAVATDTYDAATTVDASVSYRLTPKWQLSVGGVNIFNKYPTPQFDTWTDEGGLTSSVQMGSGGAYAFARLGFRF
jgi:iron complex outermembrane receptor protein